jgi:hypothetical protein
MQNREPIQQPVQAVQAVQEMGTVFLQALQRAEAVQAAEALLASDIVPTHTVKIETAIKQLSKGQDYVEMIETVDHSTFEPFKAAILCDGHGSHTVPKMITRLAGQAVSADSPCTELHKIVCDEKLLGQEQSGSTAIYAKVYQDRVMIETTGDSTVIVAQWNEEEQEWEKVWKNELHKWSNLAERARLQEKSPLLYAEDAFSLQVMSHDTICRVPSTYVCVQGTMRKLAMTQAIGHDDIFGVAPCKTVIPFVQGRKYKIIGGSDGVFDMVRLENKDEMNTLYGLTAAEIADFAEAKWAQEWFPVHENNPEYRGYPVQRFVLPHEKDDVSCFVIDIDPTV